MNYIPHVKQLDTIIKLVTERCPDLDAAKVRALSEVWAQTADQIIQRTMELGQVEVEAGLHIDNRPDAIYELASLILFLERKILDHKEKTQPLSECDPGAERAFMVSEAGQAMIEATARNLADGAWKPLLQRWRAYRPLIEQPRSKPVPRLVQKGREPHRTRMHYVPQFSTKPWVDAKTGKFDVHTIGVDGEVRTRHGTAKVWGAADYLYTQRLEVRLGEIERGGRVPFRKIAQTRPLNDQDRAHWVAFLISQMIRTPREMAKIMAGTKAFIVSSGIDYGADAAHLARAFETLFDNDAFYAQFYRLIVRREWHIVIAAPDASFLRADNPVALSGSTKTGDWSLVYPLTPKKCFVVGPATIDGPQDLIPHRLELDAERTAGFNAIICGGADSSVVSLHDAAGPALKRTILTYMGGGRPRAPGQALPFWGFDAGGPTIGAPSVSKKRPIAGAW